MTRRRIPNQAPLEGRDLAGGDVGTMDVSFRIVMVPSKLILDPITGKETPRVSPQRTIQPRKPLTLDPCPDPEEGQAECQRHDGEDEAAYRRSDECT